MHARLTTSHTLNEICSFASEPQSPFIHMSSSPACSRVAYVKTVLTLLKFQLHTQKSFILRERRHVSFVRFNLNFSIQMLASHKKPCLKGCIKLVLLKLFIKQHSNAM